MGFELFLYDISQTLPLEGLLVTLLIGKDKGNIQRYSSRPVTSDDFRNRKYDNDISLVS